MLILLSLIVVIILVLIFQFGPALIGLLAIPALIYSEYSKKGTQYSGSYVSPEKVAIYNQSAKIHGPSEKECQIVMQNVKWGYKSEIMMNYILNGVTVGDGLFKTLDGGFYTSQIMDEKKYFIIPTDHEMAKNTEIKKWDRIPVNKEQFEQRLRDYPLYKLFRLYYRDSVGVWHEYRKYNHIELDCWNDELKIGFEFNGPKHYKMEITHPSGIPYQREFNKYSRMRLNDVIKKYRMRELGYGFMQIYSTDISNMTKNFTQSLDYMISRLLDLERSHGPDSLYPAKLLKPEYRVRAEARYVPVREKPSPDLVPQQYIAKVEDGGNFKTKLVNHICDDFTHIDLAQIDVEGDIKFAPKMTIEEFRAFEPWAELAENKDIPSSVEGYIEKNYTIIRPRELDERVGQYEQNNRTDQFEFGNDIRPPFIGSGDIAHTFNVREPYFSQIASGVKIIEGRRGNQDSFRHLVGKKVQFKNGNDVIVAIVTGISWYPDLLAFLTAENFRQIIPDAIDVDEAKAAYNAFWSDDEVANSGGIVAIKIKVD